MSSAIDDLIVSLYDCRACLAKAGDKCRTMRHHPGRPHKVGYATHPHVSRYDQHRRARQGTDPVVARVVARLYATEPDCSAVEHHVQLSRQQADALRAWLASPNGSHGAGRVTFESVVGGGVLVRTRPYQAGETHDDRL